MRYLATLAAAAVLAVSSPAADDPPPLKKGDRIVFLGDSITAGGVGPKGYVTLIKNALAEKHKDLGIEVIGAGISGNKVPDLQTPAREGRARQEADAGRHLHRHQRRLARREGPGQAAPRRRSSRPA